MRDLYSILGLSEDVSKEDLRKSFVAWKKEQQNLLRIGTQQEKELAVRRISEAMILYKNVMGRTDLLYTSQRHVKPISESQSPIVSEETDNSDADNDSARIQSPVVVSDSVIPVSRSVAKRKTNESAHEKKKSDVSQMNHSRVDYSSQTTKYAVTAVAVIVVVAVIGGIGFKVMHGNRMDSGGPSAGIFSFLSRSSDSREDTPRYSKNIKSTSKDSTKSERALLPADEVPKSPEDSSEKRDEKNNTGESKSDQSQQRYNPGKTPAQREAVQTLYTFHESITKKEYRQAYNCLSGALQKHMSYDGWVPGFKTTVSSTVYDVKVASEKPDQIVLTYNLQAIDNPGGTQNFSGTVVVVKTGNGWKLDKITNKAK